MSGTVGPYKRNPMKLPHAFHHVRQGEDSAVFDEPASRPSINTEFALSLELELPSLQDCEK